VALRCLIFDDSAGFFEAARARLEQEGSDVAGGSDAAATLW
jgi:hypothetical protein